jgi:hypothetical protein
MLIFLSLIVFAIVARVLYDLWRLFGSLPQDNGDFSLPFEGRRGMTGVAEWDERK